MRRVEIATWADHAELLVLTRNKEMKHVRDFSNKFIVNEEAYAAGRILVVRAKKLIVGFVYVNHRLKRGDYSNIGFIGVHPAYRGQGIAVSLVARALKLSPWNRLVAHVAVSNEEATHWYTKHGWFCIGEGNWKTKGPYYIFEKTT